MKSPLHILFAQDDEFFCNIYRKKFEEEGYKVTLARNGEIALKEAQKKIPDLIILGIQLPKLDGFQVLQQLKEQAKTKKIPVFIFTQLGQKEDVTRGLSLGANEYILKSHIRPEDMIKKIEGLFSQH